MNTEAKDGYSDGYSYGYSDLTMAYYMEAIFDILYSENSS
jgi:hypothetical protein